MAHAAYNTLGMSKVDISFGQKSIRASILLSWTGSSEPLGSAGKGTNWFPGRAGIDNRSVDGWAASFALGDNGRTSFPRDIIPSVFFSMSFL
jgi:hypothetical protein